MKKARAVAGFATKVEVECRTVDEAREAVRVPRARARARVRTHTLALARTVHCWCGCGDAGQLPAVRAARGCATSQVRVPARHRGGQRGAFASGRRAAEQAHARVRPAGHHGGDGGGVHGPARGRDLDGQAHARCGDCGAGRRGSAHASRGAQGTRARTCRSRSRARGASAPPALACDRLLPLALSTSVHAHDTRETGAPLHTHAHTLPQPLTPPPAPCWPPPPPSPSSSSAS